jgi:hypothetical protein
MTSDLTHLRAVNAELLAALKDIASGKYSGVVLTSNPPQDAAVARATAAIAKATALTPAQLDAVQQDIDMGR